MLSIRSLLNKTSLKINNIGKYLNNKKISDFRFWIKIILFITYFFLLFFTLKIAAFHKHWFVNTEFSTHKIEYESFWNVEGIITFYPIQIAILMMIYMFIGTIYNKLENKSYFYSNRFKNIVLLLNLSVIIFTIFELSNKGYFYDYYKTQRTCFIFINLLTPLFSIFYCLITSGKAEKSTLRIFIIDSFFFFLIIFLHIIFISIRKYLIDKDNSFSKNYLVSSFYSFDTTTRSSNIFIVFALILILVLLQLLLHIHLINNFFYKIMKNYYQDSNTYKTNFNIAVKSFYKSFGWYLKLFLFLVCFFDLVFGFYKDCVSGEYWYVDSQDGFYLRYWNAEGLLSFYSIQVSIFTTTLLLISIIFHNMENQIYLLKTRFKNIILSWNFVMLLIFWYGILSSARDGFSEYSNTQVFLSVVSHLICPLILTIYYVFTSGIEKYKWSSLIKNEFLWVISYPIIYSIYVIFRAKIINDKIELNVTQVSDYYYPEFMDFKKPPIFKNEKIYIIFFYLAFTVLYIAIYSFFNLLNNAVYKIKARSKIL